MLVDIIIIALIGFMTLNGFRRGLILSVIRLLSWIISIALVWFAYPHIARIFGGNLIVNILIILGLFILCKVLLMFVARALKVVTRLPVIKQLNALGGGIFGFLQGALIVLFVFAIFNLASLPIINLAMPEQFATIRDAIESSNVGSFMYNNNFVENIFGFWNN